jgi:purine-binding chemotaxis protein CheW
VESSDLKKRIGDQVMSPNVPDAARLTGHPQETSLRQAAQSAVAGFYPARSIDAELQDPALSAPPQGELYLVFTLQEHEFALKAECTQGVERLIDVTPVPNVAAWVSGVINLRGSIASVVDLRAFFGLERLAHTLRTRLLTVQHNEMLICLIVDSVSEMLPIPETAIVGVQSIGSNPSLAAAIPHWATPYVSGSALVGKRSIVLLDAARLLYSDKMQRYEI